MVSSHRPVANLKWLYRYHLKGGSQYLIPKKIVTVHLIINIIAINLIMRKKLYFKEKIDKFFLIYFYLEMISYYMSVKYTVLIQAG